MPEPTCFIIQPFNFKFDKLWEDVYKPALEEAGLKPYRVDRDPGAKIPIESIEDQIVNSTIVFADITLDNPNVWYEVGYALANKKEVIMVCCSKERSGQFPFDVRHRQIIIYSNDSSSDFIQLKAKITSTALVYLQKALAYLQIAERESDPVSTSLINQISEVARNISISGRTLKKDIINSVLLQKTHNKLENINAESLQLNAYDTVNYTAFIFEYFINILQPGDKYYAVASMRFFSKNKMHSGIERFIGKCHEKAKEGASVHRIILSNGELMRLNRDAQDSHNELKTIIDNYWQQSRGFEDRFINTIKVAKTSDEYKINMRKLKGFALIERGAEYVLIQPSDLLGEGDEPKIDIYFAKSDDLIYYKNIQRAFKRFNSARMLE